MTKAFRAGGWVGLIGNSPQLAKLALDEALAAGALLLGRRGYVWLAAPAAAAALGALAVTLMCGLAGTFTALGRKPAPLLRNL